MKRSAIVLCLNLFVSVMGLTALTTQAGEYPDRPITCVVPLPPGSAVDMAARLIAEDLGKGLGQEVVIVNKPGASMTVGTGLVARSKKDGYTIAYTAASGIVYSRVANPETVSYDPEKDLEPLALHLFLPLALAVQASSPWKTFDDFLADMKKNPGKIRVSTHGVAGIDHFNLEIIQAVTGARITHVPFKGGDEVTAALLGGHVEAISHSYTLIRPHVDAGKMRILLISRKMPDFPDLPTFTELGHKQELLSGWFAMYAPAGIPEDARNLLVKAIEKAINNPEIKSKLTKLGYVVDYHPPEGLRRFVKENYEKACEIAEKIGVRKK